MKISAKFYARTDPGQKRGQNEDSCAVDPRGRFSIVADGMGGHQSGEIASRMAVDLMSQCMGSVDLAEMSSDEAIRDTLQSWVTSVNDVIHEQNSDEESAKDKMGTTLVFLGLFGSKAAVSHIGDSRCYRLRQGVFEPLTQDHCIYSDQIDPSKLPEKDRKRTRKRKYITRALGTRPEVEADIRVVDLLPGDVFLLCTDGLTDMIADVELQEKLKKGLQDLGKVAENLISVANRRGGHDNITVVIGEVMG